jgi:hypothetical protein
MTQGRKKMSLHLCSSTRRNTCSTRTNLSGCELTQSLAVLQMMGGHLSSICGGFLLSPVFRNSRNRVWWRNENFHGGKRPHGRCPEAKTVKDPLLSHFLLQSWKVQPVGAENKTQFLGVGDEQTETQRIFDLSQTRGKWPLPPHLWHLAFFDGRDGNQRPILTE